MNLAQLIKELPSTHVSTRLKNCLINWESEGFYSHFNLQEIIYTNVLDINKYQLSTLTLNQNVGPKTINLILEELKKRGNVLLDGISEKDIYEIMRIFQRVNQYKKWKHAQ